MTILKTKANAFSGMTNWNGIQVTLETNKTTGEHYPGKSGKTLRYSTICGSLFLTEDQVEAV